MSHGRQALYSKFYIELRYMEMETTIKSNI